MTQKKSDKPLAAPGAAAADHAGSETGDQAKLARTCRTKLHEKYDPPMWDASMQST